jgi:hypothetical protein
MSWRKSRREAAAMLALAAVDAVTTVALFAFEVTVVVSSSVGNMLEDWREGR